MDYRPAYPAPKPQLPRRKAVEQPAYSAHELAAAPSYSVAPADKPKRRRAVAPDEAAEEIIGGEAGSSATVEGTLERITFNNEENGYTIAKLHVTGVRKPLTIVGYLPGVSVGEALQLEGKWVQHPSYGKQLNVERYRVATPSTILSLKRYLGSGLLKGVGPVLAEHLVGYFGKDVLDILDNQPQRIYEVPNLGPRRARAIIEAWKEQRTIKELMRFLQTQGVNVSLALRIYKHYGDEAIAILSEHPYRLTEDIYGADFAVADRMAANLGLDHASDERIAAGLVHVVRQHCDGSGHVFISRAALLISGQALLGVPPLDMERVLSEVMDGESIKLEQVDGETVVYPMSLYRAEVFVASALKQLLNTAADRLVRFKLFNWQRAKDYINQRTALALSEQQQAAVRTALTNKVMVLTGGPGTGKTTTLRAIIELLRARGGSVILAAPTGRAAKRLTEATGAPARTIHRLLEIKPGGAAEYHVAAPLDADMVVIDEASMMDLSLATALLRAIPQDSHLVLVGDADQLPPVGPGNVLRDIITSESIPTVVLNTVFRQAEQSAIVANAHRINAGQPPRIDNHPDGDFFLFNETNPEIAASLIADLVAERIPSKFGFSSLEDIQVLSPMHAGPVGVEALNAKLQEALNPAAPNKAERRFGERIFREGDKVMQIVNDYDKQVYNGDIGRVVKIDEDEQTLRVLFDAEWSALYSFSELDELIHAYAISIHKSQGSEYPVVVIPLMMEHRRMLARNLLYTAVSRARKLAVIVGSREAIATATINERTATRCSALAMRLR